VVLVGCCFPTISDHYILEKCAQGVRGSAKKPCPALDLTAWRNSKNPPNLSPASGSPAITNGGPNPEGTNIGSYTTSGVTHGFVLKKGVFTSFDPPGSTSTTPNWISPQGVIVGGYIDASGANHGFILEGGKYTTVDFPGAAGTILTSLNPSGQMSGESCAAASCSTTTTVL
jgi:hypothetical protein